MKRFRVFGKLSWALSAGVVLLLGACAQNTTPTVTVPSTTSEAEPSSEVASQLAIAPSTDVASGTSETATAASVDPASGRVPNDLISNVTTLQRLPQVNPGRSNPFAAIATGPARIQSLPPAPLLASVSPAVEGMALAPFPQGVPSAPTLLPAPPTIVGTTAVSAAPALTSAPVATPASASVMPQSLASQVRISGIVQIGNQFQVLVELPNENYSRSVSVGETVMGGVRLARIDIAPNREPQVVLIEGGVETIKTVDSSGL